MTRWYISIMEGPNPRSATPVVASEDPALVRAVARALLERLAPVFEDNDATQVHDLERILRLVDEDEETETA